MLLTAIYTDAKLYLDNLQSQREEVIRVCRDINAHSKKLIFLLHRASTHPLDTSLVLTPARVLCEKVATLYHEFALTDSYPSYKGTVSNCVEELLEGLLFGYFLVHRSLLGYETLQQMVVQLVLSYDYEAKQVKETSLAIFIGMWILKQRIIPDFSISQAHFTSIANAILFPGDYFMGIFDFTGELMRYTITTMAQNEVLEKISAEVLDNLRFLRLLYSHVSSLTTSYPNLNVSRGSFSVEPNHKQTAILKKKLEVFRQSIDKVETAICSAAITKNEPSMASSIEEEIVV